VNLFSGSGASQVATSSLYEVQNDLTWHSDFQHLYSRGRKRSFVSNSARADATDEDEASFRSSEVQGILQRPLSDDKGERPADEGCLIVPAPAKRNRDHVICSLGTNASLKSGYNVPSEQPILVYYSPLFWWIVILIVIPLLLVICVICAVVSQEIVTTFPSWVEQADAASYQLARQSLQLTAASKASLMSAVVFEAVRDLHLLSRLAGWLFFGGVGRSGSLTEMKSVSEECKAFPEQTCSSYFDSDRAICPCEWNDPIEETCTRISNSTLVRDLQYPFWALQAPTNGFPSTANETLWYTDVSSLPGAEEGENASGFETAYDRARVGSSLAAALLPVYNYASSLGWSNRVIAVYSGFDADGMFLGFDGCQHISPVSAATCYLKKLKSIQLAIPISDFSYLCAPSFTPCRISPPGVPQRKTAQLSWLLNSYVHVLYYFSANDANE